MKTELSSYKIAIIDDNGNIIIPEKANIQTFLTTIIRKLNDRKILDVLLNETSYIVMLVRERIENEKVLEKFGVIATTTDEDEEEPSSIGKAITEEEYTILNEEK